ncbi:hypothetical protein ANN_16223 [Periplaneta americana]|uniref:Uncharacterized protein n=1 Tax=Periplaneta americana TaxID=6978 RepID=A0ABQ8SJG6_PERAM|nr:hypothetical protein ANN_16223 [Periplaneta americana]
MEGLCEGGNEPGFLKSSKTRRSRQSNQLKSHRGEMLTLRTTASNFLGQWLSEKDEGKYQQEKRALQIRAAGNEGRPYNRLRNKVATAEVSVKYEARYRGSRPGGMPADNTFKPCHFLEYSAPQRRLMCCKLLPNHKGLQNKQPRVALTGGS